MMRIKRKQMTDLAVDLCGLMLGLIVTLPIVYAVFGAFKSSGEFASFPPTFFPKSITYTQNFVDVLTRVPMLRYFLNSFIVALLISTVRLLCAVLAAYAFVYFTFPGRGVLFFFILGTMMLPPDTMIITNYQTTAHLGLLNSYLGMSIVSFVGASQMFMLRQSFRNTPRALREAAAMDGCGDLRYIVYILVPVSRPVLVTLFVQSFIAAWNTYLWPLMTTSTNDMRTVQVGIAMLTTPDATNYETILAGVVLSLIPALFVFLFLRKGITKAMTGGSLVG